MNSLRLIFTLAFHDVIRRSSRSLLTALGITVSVASLVIVVALVQGAAASITRNFDTLGASVLTVQSRTSFADQLLGRQNRLSYDDYIKLSHSVTGVSNIVPSFFPYAQTGVVVGYGNQTTTTRVLAVSPGYQDAYKVYPSTGRFFTQSDEQSRRKVCVIGDRVRTNLKLGPNPIGSFIRINGSWFKIVGLMDVRGEIFGFSQDDYIAIPFSTGETELSDPLQQDINIVMNVTTAADSDQIQDRVTSVLRAMHKLRPGQDNDFQIATARQLSDSISSITGLLTAVFSGMIGISMLVGGIGIMNIMLATVSERVREIGICKALGAKRHHILIQFLAEAGIISTIGGVAGLLIGMLIAYIIGLLVPALAPLHVPLWAGAFAVGFATLIGLFFGVAPAAQAAAMDPIEALRHE